MGLSSHPPLPPRQNGQGGPFSGRQKRHFSAYYRIKSKLILIMKIIIFVMKIEIIWMIMVMKMTKKNRQIPWRFFKNRSRPLRRQHLVDKSWAYPATTGFVYSYCVAKYCTMYCDATYIFMAQMYPLNPATISNLLCSHPLAWQLQKRYVANISWCYISCCWCIMMPMYCDANILWC